MKSKLFPLFISLLLLQLPFLCYAQEDSLRVRQFRFHFDNAKIEWDSEGLLKAFRDSVSPGSVKKVNVSGFASPTGPVDLNNWLAQNRAQEVADTIAILFPDVPVTVNGYGEDWQGLSDLISRESVNDDLRDALAIISAGADYFDDRLGRKTDSRTERLKALNEGKTYAYLSKHIFPQLRRSDVIFYLSDVHPQNTTSGLPQEEISAADSSANAVLPDSGTDIPAEEVRELPAVTDTSSFTLPSGQTSISTIPQYTRITPENRDNTINKGYDIAFRTNLLVPLLNIGVEFPLGRHISIGGDYYTPWFWFDKDNKTCYEYQGAKVHIRYWFGKTLSGHSLSLAGFGSHYDFEKDYKGRQGEYYGAALEYNYTVSVGRYIRLEFGIGLGYARLPRRYYTVYYPGGRLIRNEPSDRVYNWIGPTSANISIVVPMTFNSKGR